MTIWTWNWFDWFLVFIVVFSMLAAFRRGLVRAIFGLIGFIGGFQIATWNYGIVGDWIMESKLSLSQLTSRVVAFLLIVVAIAAAMELAGRLIQKILKHVGLGWFDRILGMGFGFARGCLIGLVVLMITTTFVPQSDAVTTSALTPYFFAVAHDVSFLVPQYLQQHMVNGAIDYKHGPQHWINSY